MLAPIIGQAHRQLPDAAPAGPIGCQTCVTRHAGHRPNIDNAPVPARDHAARQGLRDEKTPAQIGVKDQVPVFPGNVERRFANVATRIVDQDVQMTKFLFGHRRHSFNAIEADIKFQ